MVAYSNDYNCFAANARNYMAANRPTWSGNDKKYTLNAIWQANERVKRLFAGSKSAGPDPDWPDWLVVPDDPYSQEQAQTAKTEGTFEGYEENRDEEEPRSGGEGSPGPGSAVESGGEAVEAAEPVEPVGPVEAEEPIELGGEAVRPDAPTGSGGRADLPNETPATYTIVAPDERPYNFWPQGFQNNDAVFTSNAVQRQEQVNPGRGLRQWHGVRELKRPARGSALLLYYSDEMNNVVDKMVSTGKALSPKEWRDPQQWRDRRPREIKIHELVEQRHEQQPGTCQHLIDSRGSRVIIRRRRYDVFEDYFDEHTLVKILGDRHEGAIAEAFVWQVLRALARACLTLRTGSHEEDVAVEGWRPITHLSLQPHNVHLHIEERDPGQDQSDEERPRKRSRYVPDTAKPSRKGKERALSGRTTDEQLHRMTIVPVLGDFSLAFYTVCEDPRLILDNPDDYILGKEDTRYAPVICFQPNILQDADKSQEHQAQYRDLAPVLLDGKTDVWGIGMICANLVCNELLELGPVKEDALEPTDVMKPPELNTERMRRVPVGKRSRDEAFVPTAQSVFTGGFFPYARYYSGPLLDTIRRCLCYEKDARFSLRELLDRVDEELANTPDLMQLDAFDVDKLIAACQTSDGPPAFGYK
ncbi:hypothetical protein NX059_001272 [Plenodomus lindquistii]|nr:hypothetical protein NX059_001272 [Plenodomus lindquistii]